MNSGLGLRVASAAAAVLLAACAGQPLRPVLDPAAQAAAEAGQARREAALAADPAWSLSGRVAISNAGKGGSGRIEWDQTGSSYQVALSAPVTRQSWRLSVERGWAVIEGIEGGPRQGPDPRALLLDTTGWEIPVEALSAWVRGARAAGLGRARVEYGADGLPWRIEQGGWTIDFRWPAPTTMADSPPLPERVDASRDGARVRLVVDRWGAR